ncbi:MAG TPA: MlaD family protein [Candidatus Omnitrophota bacterium]|mgnify:CR=1 FL=1|nr:MlaD family protein [Candidatus Omnitrophota bacterium]
MKKRTDTYSHDEIRSGLFITLAAIALIALLFAAGRLQIFQETYKVNILFNYISGLQTNAPVHFAGHKVGKVTKIEILENQSKEISVTVSLSQKAVLRKDSKAFIEIMGFMGEKFVELTPGSADAPPLPAGEPLIGTDPIAFYEILKKGTDIADELQKTTASFEELVVNLNDALTENRTDIQQIVQNLNSASGNMKEMTEDLKRHPWKLVFKGKDDTQKKKRFFFF